MKTLKTLLVPIDGSEASGPAVEYALWLAQSEGAEVTFCHSVDLTATVAECTTPYSVGDIGPIIDALEEESTQLLADAQAKAKARGVTAITLELAGPPVAAIIEAAQQRSASAIVIGSHGRSGASRFFLGSTTEGVLRRTDLPVFVVHAESTASAAPSPFAHILVALDDSDPADARVDFALSLAHPERTTVELVHVLHMKTLHQLATGQRYDVRRRFHEERAAAQELLDAAAERLYEHDIKVTKTMIEGAPVVEILDLAHRQHADLIIIGTHGRRGLRRLFLGSVAEEVVRGATVPVAVVRRRIVPDKVGATNSAASHEVLVVAHA